MRDMHLEPSDSPWLVPPFFFAAALGPPWRELLVAMTFVKASNTGTAASGLLYFLIVTIVFNLESFDAVTFCV